MLKTGLLALALATAGGTASADPLFDVYRSACVKTDGDGVAAMAAATANGFSPMPKAMLDPLSQASGIDNAEGRMRSDEKGLSFIVVGSKQFPVASGSMSMRFCAVVTTANIASDGPLHELAAWAATPPLSEGGDQGITAYAFLKNGDAHETLAGVTPGALQSAAATGRMRLAFFQARDATNMLAYAVPTL